MDFIEANPLPEACEKCADRKECLAKGEPEWCCDECDYALLRWPIFRAQELRAIRTLKKRKIAALQRQIEEIDQELRMLEKSVK